VSSSLATAGDVTRRSESLAGSLGAAAPIAAIVLAAGVVLHLAFGTVGDVSWLITVDEKWLHGATPYRDIVEINPPASLLLYWPAVWLARSTGLWPEFLVACFGFAAAALSLAFAARFARRAGVQSLNPATVAIVATIAFLLPGRSFDERDVVAAFLGLPLLGLWAARAAGASVAALEALGAGALMGVMIALKPPYALVPAAALPYLIFKVGFRRLLFAAEIPAIALLSLLYVAAVVWGFPAYVEDTLPLGVAVYAPIRDSVVELLLNPSVLPAAAMAAAVLWGCRDLSKPPIVLLLLGALGALLAFIAQGKGWAYQAFPLAAYAALAAALALDFGGLSKRTLVSAAGLALVVCVAIVATRRAPMLFLICGAVGAELVARRFGFAPPRPPSKGAAMPLSPTFLFAAAFGASVAVFAVEGVHSPGLDAALARVAAHPKVLAISESLGFGHPLVRSVGGEWVQRVPSLWITAGARRLIEEHPDDKALTERLQPFIEKDRDRLVEDILRNRPDAILVGKLGTRFHDWAWSDPKITAARSDYQFFAANADPDWPAEIWIRKDLLALRATTASP